MAKNKNRKQGSPQERAQQQSQRGTEQQRPDAQQGAQSEVQASPADFAPGGSKRQKKFGHN
ncbi:hypothetical protein DY218_15035 [Streptomyces triticagri]|uniref:Small hydrophilic protein n=1 Tax=Streptomyces triticagri TaxID=2293568 RepID=A0A372M4M1_9ACTN|nr:hypothetical protein [Streptomyces triticagri]RFU85888.1 hypothetical protein DY218_15035 [Streptomyces triticagri]